MRFVRGFAAFWYDFVVGDDWRIALGVVLVLGIGALLVGTAAIESDVLMPLLAVAIMVIAGASIVRGARR